MYISDVLSSNRKGKTKLKRLREVKRYFLSMYRCYMLQMYDMNYIDDPTRFDKSQIIQNIVEMGINDLFNYSGKIELTSNHTLFAMYKNKDNDDKYKFLKTLHNILKYQEYSKKVDNLYEEFSFREKDSNVIKTTMYPKGAMIVQRSGIIFDKATARCISSFEDSTEFCTIRDGLWELAMKELGIPEEDWFVDGVLDSHLLHNEEVECIEGILNGYFVVSNGKYTDKLKSWLLSHRWNSDSKYKAYTQGLYDYLFGSQVNSVEDLINKKLTEVEGIEGSKVLAIQKDIIYYNIPREYFEMPFGVFALVCDTSADEYLLPDGNIVNGYSGELYTLNRLVEDEINYVGCPIMMNTDVNSTCMLYDLEQTDVRGISWFNNDTDVSISFGDVDVKENIFKEGTLEYDMYNGYVNSLTSSEGLINKLKVSKFEDLETAKKAVYKYIES